MKFILSFYFKFFRFYLSNYIFLSCSFISNTMLEWPGLSNLTSRIFGYLGQGGGWVDLKEWSTVGLEVLPLDLFEAFLLSIVLTYLCKRYVPFVEVHIVCFYSFPAKGGCKPQIELKVISQHSWMSWTFELEVLLSWLESWYCLRQSLEENRHPCFHCKSVYNVL